MKAIVCVDDKGGVSFNKRRQSRDRIFNSELLKWLSGETLYLSPYSAKLFEGYQASRISEHYLELAGESDFCFVEREELEGFEEKIHRLILVKWNRTYPSDKYLKLDLRRYLLVKTIEFAGSSHEKITVEEYEKN